MLLAFTRATASHQELGHCMRWQLSWPTAVSCGLKAYFSVRITTFWHYLLPLCFIATCNVTITFCCLIMYAAQKFFLFIIFMGDVNHAWKYFKCEQFSNYGTLHYQSSSLQLSCCSGPCFIIGIPSVIIAFHEEAYLTHTKSPNCTVQLCMCFILMFSGTK